MIPYKKGKRGIIFLDGDTIIKKKNPKAEVDTLQNEITFLKILNKHNIGPKLIDSSEDSVKMEFIDGVLIGEYFEKETKENILKVIKDLLEQCYKMDQLGISKFEMTRPHKHIIVRDNKPVLIDFERCRKTEKPKNVTQFLQYLTSENISNLLRTKSINLDKKIIIEELINYRSGKENFDKIRL